MKSEGENNKLVQVLQNIQKISKMLEVTFEGGIEDQMMDIFEENEKTREKKKGTDSVMGEQKNRDKEGPRN